MTSSEQFSLNGLNPAQLKAVCHPPNVPLQILAGPGSGKTKVLTSRIAYLIIQHGISPSSICAVTFTNKAANEMRERLKKLIGKERTSQIRMGTFHALCVRFLRQYGTEVGLDSNFTVCDADESKKMIAGLLKAYKAELTEKDMSLKEGTVLSMISREKARGHSPQDFMAEVQADIRKAQERGLNPENDIERIMAEIYGDYQKALRKSNSADFDDLLVFGCRLFAKHKPAVKWCRHVLVDEFQDTNFTQYDIMRSLAFHNCVSIVGDPDQSIYGWRSAEVENLSKMEWDFPSTQQIFLEENYRSTGAILKTSLALISQDRRRVNKSLYTSHPKGRTPAIVCHGNEKAEAAFIAQEVKRLMAHTGGTLNFGDFVVLLRYNALSRNIESALQKEGIPNRVLAGHKFFERLEIKDLLAYLQLVDNPQYTPAFLRAINVPARGVGEKTLKEIELRASKSNLSHLQAVEKICDGKSPDIKPAIKNKATPFVKAIRTLREMASQDWSPPDLIRKLLDLIDYEEHLRKTQQDWESRWENVKELITFASEVDVTSGTEHAETDETTPLRLFLQASMLSSEGDNDSEDNKDKVTLATCHAAKGLEWPVVIVPSTEEGTFPFIRAEDKDEERRLLYVACTRAQALLYLSYVNLRKIAGVDKDRDISTFVTKAEKEHPNMLTKDIPILSTSDRGDIATVLRRQPPDEDEVKRKVEEYERTVQYRYQSADPLAAPTNFDGGFLPVQFTRPGMQFPPMQNMLGAMFGAPTTSYTSYTLSEHKTTAPMSRNENSKPIQTNMKPMSTALTATPGSSGSRSTIPPVSQKQRVVSTTSAKPVSTPLGRSASRRDNTPSQAQSRSIPALSSASVGATVYRSMLPSEPQTQKAIPSLSKPVSAPVVTPIPATTTAGVKRRLGMGRGGTGYTNKKFKPPN